MIGHDYCTDPGCGCAEWDRVERAAWRRGFVSGILVTLALLSLSVLVS